MNFIGDIVSGIIGIVPKTIGYFFDSPELKEAKEKGKIKLLEAELEAKTKMMVMEAKATSDYDNKAQDNMKESWKDEYLILLHTMPIWGYVIPNETLHEGLDKVWFNLNNAPYEWWVIYIGIVASTFGLRWLFNKNRVEKMLNEKSDIKNNK